MCGICGIVYKDHQLHSQEHIRAMNGRIRHRGPDDEGFAIGPRAAIAMRRLSIIDLAGGHQPIYNEDGSLSIVFNGEIYNYRELRQELQSHGHRFTTSSDTEAILHGYEQWGEECVNHFNGMFAFAIWNARTAELFLARDPVGIKPLYLYEDARRLLFASEIKSLLAAGGVPRDVDPVALHHYLSFLYVPPPRTMLRGITNLPPGHWARWSNGSLRVQEYWAGPQAAFEPEPAQPVSPEDVLQMLRDAVRRHLVADVPVGCLLSGGIDSSAVAALMAQEVGPGFKTFTAGFPGAGIYDERPFAREVARHVGSDHTEVEIRPSAAELLPHIVWHLDEPLADASVIPNYLVCQLAASQVKVALSGIGGDEAFGGYRRYFATSLSGLWGRMPAGFMQAALSAAARIVPVSGDNPVGERLRLARKFYDCVNLDEETRYLAWNAFFTQDMKRELYASGLSDGMPDSLQEAREWFRRVPHGSLTRRAMYVDLKTYLPGDPLLLADKLSMAHSLELRVPFLDRELLEFASRIPSRQHLRGKETKSLLRAAVRHLLPPQILTRPKRGFGTPIDVWLRMHLRTMMLDLLSDQAVKARGWFNPAYVRKLIQKHLEGSNDYSQHLWALLVLEIWHRQFVEGAEVSDASTRLPRPVPPAPRSTRKKLRILIATDVDPDDVSSGAERVLAEETRELLHRGHQITIISRCTRADKVGVSDHNGLRIARFHAPEGRGIRDLWRTLAAAETAVEHALQRQIPDLLYIQQPLTGFGVMRSSAARRVPAVFLFHSPWSEEYRIRALERRAPLADPNATRPTLPEFAQMKLRTALSRAVLRQCVQIRVLSDFMAEQCRSRYGIPLTRLSLIPGAMDADRFAPEPNREAIRSRLGVHGDAPLLFTLRGLEARMGLGNLLEAMRFIIDCEPNAVCVIGGTGPLGPALARRADELHLGDNVKFAGFIPDADLPSYYSAADLFVLPTAALEGFGLVTVEAMACGTPVLGTPVGATPEILLGFDPAFISPDASPNGIATGVLNALQRVREDPQIRERCREYVQANYTWSIIADRLEHLFMAVAERGAV